MAGQDKLLFWSRSPNAAPGSGTGEVVLNPFDYPDLASIPDWRKVLSNFHVAPFKMDGMTFNTIEHAFQAYKISLADPEAAFLFALESGSELSRGDGLAAQRQRKMVRLDPAQLRHWGKIKEGVMAQAAARKYEQCQKAREVLAATKNAQLWHIVSRSKPVRFIHLELIRACHEPVM